MGLIGSSELNFIQSLTEKAPSLISQFGLTIAKWLGKYINDKIKKQIEPAINNIIVEGKSSCDKEPDCKGQTDCDCLKRKYEDLKI